MEFFLDQVRTLLPVLGFDVLRDPIALPAAQPQRGRESNAAGEQLELILRESREGLTASAVQVGDETVVLAGSLGRKDPDYAANKYAGLRDQLIADGSLVGTSDGTKMTFTRDVPFSSPTAAAAVIYGRNANGRTSWRLKGTNQTLKEYQDALLDAVVPSSEAAE